MTGWLLLFVGAAVICAATAAGLIELHWNKIPQPGPLLARWLRQLSDRLDKPSLLDPDPPAIGSPSVDQVVEAPEPKSESPANLVAGTQKGWYKVLTSADLLRCVGGDDVIRRIATVSRLAPAVFERDLLPVLQSYAEFVQLLPASESHHHANAGGLLAHTLEVLLYAMTFRNGYLLPRGAGAEVIDAERDYWTYAVFLGALLHDVGKPVSDLRVQLRRHGISDAIQWVPLGGSLVECGAVEYHIGFIPKAQRDYTAHGKLGLSLLQKLAPTSTLSFLSRAPSVLLQLNQYLVGGANDSPISEIVKRADQESTRRNLASGSRSRLDTATSVPLVEQLMTALRSMLKQGTHLPLNRDGSAGWVYGDSIWFVAKRLADSVREFIKKHAAEDADGIPGETKNDRLFDTWQEYGCIMQNPQTSQAIWYVMVQGLDSQGQESYMHRLSVLRFPLAKVWDSAEHYPPQMSGSIEVLSKEKGEASAEQPVQTEYQAATDALPAVDGPNSLDGAVPGAGAESTASRQEADATPPSAPTTAAATSKQPESRKVPVPKFAQQAATKKKPNVETQIDPDDYLDAIDGAKAEAKAIRIDREMGQAPNTIKAVATDEVKQRPKAAPTQTKAEPNILPPVDAAPTEVPPTAPSQTPKLERTSPEASTTVVAATAKRPPAAPSAVPRPVVLPSSAPPAIGKSKEPSPLAIQFMKWLQGGLADGSIKHNELHAPVHFVPQGMALVSPLIFREYASQFGESPTGEPLPAPESTGEGASRLGLIVQREVIRADWHVAAPGGLNVWAFQVKRKGTAKPSRLAAVVLKDPSRWVMPVPPPNPFITPAEPDGMHPKTAA